MRRALRMLAICLLGGIVISLLVAVALAMLVDVTKATPKTYRVFDGRVAWNVDVWRTRGAERYQSLRVAGLAWSEEQAAGAPDTTRYGDEHSAWASAVQDNQPEWLELEYRQPIRATSIQIHETYNPGAVTKVTLFDSEGREHVAWQGKDPATTQRAIAVVKLPITADVATQRVRIDLDSPAVPGWNEIDAVGLVEANGTLHWAKRVRASSTYARGGEQVTGSVLPQVPRWTGLPEPTPEFADEMIKRESRVVDAYGWPLVALRADRADVNAVVLPIKPIWNTLAIDALFFGAILATLRWVLTRPIRSIAEGSRARRGCCIRCGYDLQFDLKQGCPECGWRRA